MVSASNFGLNPDGGRIQLITVRRNFIAQKPSLSPFQWFDKTGIMLKGS